MKHKQGCPFYLGDDKPMRECKCACKNHFETEADIWQYLLDGEKVIGVGEFNRNEIGYFRDGEIIPRGTSFRDSHNWHPYHEPKTIKRWVVVNSHGGILFFNQLSKPNPDKTAIACVPVTITYTEGEGL